MNSVHYACGCSISRSMYGEQEVREVHHCQEHWSLFSQDKTLRQMAAEITAIHAPPTLGVSVSESVQSDDRVI